jgi:3-hydroxyisobutyrate dehydrogenase
MVGAKDEALFEKAKGILQLMGQRITYCGEVGMGQTAKLCNNVFYV